MAIQKSARETRYRRRISLTSIMPKTTASIMIAASTALGKNENKGARMSRVKITSTPVVSEATGVLAPAESLRELADRLVESGIPWTRPEPTLDMPWATDSWLISTR